MALYKLHYYYYIFIISMDTLQEVVDRVHIHGRHRRSVSSFTCHATVMYLNQAYSVDNRSQLKKQSSVKCELNKVQLSNKVI